MPETWQKLKELLPMIGKLVEAGCENATISIKNTLNVNIGKVKARICIESRNYGIMIF